MKIFFVVIGRCFQAEATTLHPSVTLRITCEINDTLHRFIAKSGFDIVCLSSRRELTKFQDFPYDYRCLRHVSKECVYLEPH